MVVDVDDRARVFDFAAALTEATQRGAVEGEDRFTEGRSTGLNRLEARQVLE